MAQVTAPETAEIYRSLCDGLRRKFGGTIDDANADAIAFAASELYRKDVEPRLWEQKTAEEILDTFGVPRAGAFTRYSLSDRLLLLRRSANRDRTVEAQALLSDLGVPEADSSGSPLSLKQRLTWLIDDVGASPASVPVATETGPHPNGSRDAVGDADVDGVDSPPGPQELVEALEAIRDAVRSDEEEGPPDAPPEAPAPPPPPEVPAAELIGLGTVVAGIQEELIRLRQAVETVENRLDEVLSLLRAGGGWDPQPGAPDAPVRPEPVAAEPMVAAPDDLTQVVPVVPQDVVADDTVSAPAEVPPPRRRGLPKLIVIAVVLGLVIAGVAIAISMVGWGELRSRLNLGSVDVPRTLVTDGGSARDLAGQVLDMIDQPPRAG